jgi:hypothetical protein
MIPAVRDNRSANLTGIFSRLPANPLWVVEPEPRKQQVAGLPGNEIFLNPACTFAESPLR